VRAGASNGDEGRGSRRWLMKSWHARRRVAGEGNRAGAGGEGRVEVDPAGGGATAAPQQRRRWALHRWHGGQIRATRARGRIREERGPKDLCAKLKDSRGLSVKQNFPLI
jgi:hypothetical protein